MLDKTLQEVGQLERHNLLSTRRSVVLADKGDLIISQPEKTRVVQRHSLDVPGFAGSMQRSDSLTVICLPCLFSLLGILGGHDWSS